MLGMANIVLYPSSLALAVKLSITKSTASFLLGALGSDTQVSKKHRLLFVVYKKQAAASPTISPISDRFSGGITGLLHAFHQSTNVG